MPAVPRVLTHFPAPRSAPRAASPPGPDADLTLGAGFVLYIGLDPRAGSAHNAALVELAETLRDLAEDVLPVAESYTSLSLTPRAAADDTVSTVRNSLAGARDR